MSVSLVNVPLGLPGCVNPSGSKSFAYSSNQIFEPCSANKSAT